MVKVGQRFKSYRELCKYMGEKVTTGTAKEAQLKRWGYQFKWHKEKYQIVIDEVYEEAAVKELRGGNNDKHVEVYMPYVRERLIGASIEDGEFVGGQRLMGSIMRLIPMKLYRQMNQRGMRRESFYKKAGLEEEGSFEEYLSVAGMVMKDTVWRCMKRMQKNGEIEFECAEVFVVKDGSRRYLDVTGFDELVRKTEFDVCNEMAVRLKKKTKGRQLVHYIKGQPELMNEFYERCLKRLFENWELRNTLSEKYLALRGRPLKLENIQEYYKGFYFRKIDRDQIANARGPDKVDMQERQLLVYDDTFPRIAKGMSISKKDIARIEDLIKANAKKDYS